MVIGYDAKRVVSNGTGLGSYGRTLVNSLIPLAEKNGDSLRLYAPDSGRDDLRMQVNTSDSLQFAYPLKAHNRLQKDLWRTRGIVTDLQKDGVQVFHGLSGELPKGIHKSGIRTVLTIHDLIFICHPEYYNWLDVIIYKQKFHASLREADKIIAISECTKRDIIKYGNVDPSRIEVVYQSCGVKFKTRMSDAQKAETKAKYNLPDRYILNVGTIEQRKNVLLAVKALPNLPEDIHLVIVGRQTKYAKEVNAYITQHGLSDRVHMLCGVPNADLYSIYQQAECFVYPSRYEGFGIPIIEAIQSGLPVVAATGSCLEEAGGPDCIYVHPDDEKAMAEAVKSLLHGTAGRTERMERSVEYIKRFENADVAQQMMAVYERVLG